MPTLESHSIGFDVRCRYEEACWRHRLALQGAAYQGSILARVPAPRWVYPLGDPPQRHHGYNLPLELCFISYI
jgi:hypothetical protein